mmetsp:Transcript_13277/g.33760  ORF Transcript_13277/g.33760 Transcript_13277/m.33760 type:complete len:280 (+) Transcript_13277:1227-2066(+)
MLECVVPTSSSPVGATVMLVTWPEIWSPPMCVSTLNSSGVTMVSASPEPSTRLPLKSRAMAVIWRGMRFLGPIRLKSFCPIDTSSTSPVSVPANTFWSSSDTTRHVKQRRVWPSWQSIGRTLRSPTSKVHTRRLFRPAVMMVSSLVFDQDTASARSLAAGLPHIATPREFSTSTCHTTRLLSSSPPSDARNSPDGEKASACTDTLCSCSEQTTAFASRFHTRMGARKPMCVTCPEARMRGSDGCSAMHEIRSEWPWRKVWSLGSSMFLSTSVEPMEWTR